MLTVVVLVLCLIVLVAFAPGEAGHFVVVRFAGRRCDVPGPTVAAAGDAQGARALVGGGATTQLEAALEAAGAAYRWHALVDHVHHAADGTRAVEQRAWASDDLDALGLSGLGGHRMVGAEARDVTRADPLFEDTDALAGQAANHRAAGTRPVKRRMDTGLLGQRLAEARLPPEV